MSKKTFLLIAFATVAGGLSSGQRSKTGHLFPSASEKDASTVIDFYTHETTEAIKVFNDHIFVYSQLYSEPSHRLITFDRSGVRKGEIVIKTSPLDFTVTPNGIIIFLTAGLLTTT